MDTAMCRIYAGERELIFTSLLCVSMEGFMHVLSFFYPSVWLETGLLDSDSSLDDGHASRQVLRLTFVIHRQCLGILSYPKLKRELP